MRVKGEQIPVCIPPIRSRPPAPGLRPGTDPHPSGGPRPPPRPAGVTGQRFQENTSI